MLLLALHHIVSDGWSTGVLIRELAALYPAFPGGQPSPLPELPVQYADFAALAARLAAGRGAGRAARLLEAAARRRAAVLELPTDRPRPPVQTFRGAALPVRCRAALAAALTRSGQREGATPFMVLLAAFQVLLSRYAGQDESRVGSPIAGRAARSWRG